MKRKYDFQFLNYFRSIFYAPVMRVPLVGSFLAAYFILGLNFTFGIAFSSNGWAIFLGALGSIIFIAGVSVNAYLDRTPNLASLVPVSEKRKLAYRCLSILLMALLIFVFMMLFFLIIGVITLLFSMIPGCNDVSEGEDIVVEIESVVFPIGVYGGIFAAAYQVIMYSAGVIVGLFKRRRNRNIFLGSLCAAMLLAYILMGIPYRNNPVLYGGERLTIASPFVNVCYEAMKLPWLCVALWCVVAVAAAGVTVWLLVREYRKKRSY